MTDELTTRVPLLSVCIPTYNRADWLRVSLAALLPQIAQSEGLAELVVSDNASEDETPEVIEAMRPLGPLRSHRNGTNVGFMRNMHLLVSELAHGEFVWLLGDDDIACEGSIGRILDALRANPDLDYFYANYAVWQPAQVPLPTHETADLLRLGKPRQADLQDRRVGQLEELIPGDANCFTPIYCSVWRRRLATEAFGRCTVDEPFSTVASVFPHAQFIAERLIHKPAWYLGEPCVISSQETSWSKYWPITVLELVPRLYDGFERSGVDASILHLHRRFMLSLSVEPLRQMLTRADTPRREQFALGWFLWKHWRFPETRSSLLPVCLDYWKSCLPRPLRRTLHLLTYLVKPSRLAQAVYRTGLARLKRQRI